MAEERNINKKRIGFPVNSLRICVDNCEGTNVDGRICSVGLKDILYFQDYSGLILVIDQALDMIGTPQVYQKKRSFQIHTEPHNSYHVPKRYKDEMEIHKEHGNQKTVDVVIISRQHTSMQGYIYNIEGEKINCFSSDIELMNLVLDPYVEKKSKSS
ncbi:MAG: hypothetical protein RR275_00090 [Lachnospiraceae bacterium]